jgi:hypothetical protein
MLKLRRYAALTPTDWASVHACAERKWGKTINSAPRRVATDAKPKGQPTNDQREALLRRLLDALHDLWRAIEDWIDRRRF